MNWIDGILIALLLAMVIVGSKKGLIRELMAFVVFFAAVILRTTNVDGTVTGGFKRSMVFPAAMYGIFCVLFLAAVGRALGGLPAFGSPTMLVASQYIALGLERTGAANVIAAIILDFRGYDTLGEATVLFTAVVGVLTITRRAGRKERSGGGES